MVASSDMNMSCKLCGFRVNRSHAEESSCPVCGQEYTIDRADDTAGGGGPDDTACAGGLLSPPVQSAGIDGVGWGAASAQGVAAKTPSCLDPELEFLLRRLPQKSDIQRRDEAVLRVAGVLPDHREEPGVVHIRPRIDPTMRVLKVKKTE